MIRPATPEDAGRISTIYNHFVEHTVVTFEETPVSKEEMLQRMEEVQSQFPWLVYEVDGMVAGYAYAGKWKARSAYRYAVETSIYLDPDFSGKGIGTVLYTELTRQLRTLGLHSLIGGVALPNDASVRLHERLGFEQIAQFKEVGFKFGTWVDVGYWQCRLS